MVFVCISKISKDWKILSSFTLKSEKGKLLTQMAQHQTDASFGVFYRFYEIC